MTNFNALPDMYLQSNFPRWIFWSRASQFILAFLVLILSAYASVQFVPTLSGLNIFTAILTLIAIPYTFIGPRKLQGFYHVYAEVVLEFFLFIFWLGSFASTAEYVSTFDWATKGIADVDPSLVDPFSGLQRAFNCFKAVTAFGALLFFLSFANFIFLVVYVIQKRRAERRSGINNTNQANNNDLEINEQSKVYASPQVPTNFDK
ncbi:hypothetical protein GP486_003498 [Trichoglossum hirsutum]|uniref:MARVEL domain-containing protein n=1 Tax=Trichoglossum hirsutum TaxID=265104 RepID=A0A9P8LD52_9PEZI|nr:hypothetical protein GP486_003498 [Trichoglossum hirsutum]